MDKMRGKEEQEGKKERAGSVEEIETERKNEGIEDAGRNGVKAKRSNNDRD